MSSFQTAVGLPPLSTIAAVTQEPDAAPGSGVASSSGLDLPTGAEYRDARIKDPVPKKLKGQANSVNGNFGILQMDLGAGHESPLERDELAKRASESTELAAMRAYQSGHRVSTVKRFVRVPAGDPAAWDSYCAASTADQRAPQSASPPSARVRALTATETKEEQARLLTLLRSLSPSLVVDQICKALAYFGGIPGAKPPSDGVFPKSELANGSGSGFVGWIAEIFPKLPNETTHAMKAMPQTIAAAPTSTATDSQPDAPAAAVSSFPSDGAPPNPQPTEDNPAADATEPPVSTKRPRGRPKGSKASKTRSDKGVKKGPLKARQSLAAVNGDASAVHDLPPSDLRHGEDSWVDVDDDSMLDGGVGGNLFFQTSADAVDGTRAHSNSVSGTRLVSVPGLDALTANANATLSTTDPPRKRGRPKGSKNRPKVPPSDAPENEVASAYAGRPTVTPIPPPVVPNMTAAQKLQTNSKAKASGAKRAEVSGQGAGGGINRGQEFSSSQLQAFDMPTGLAVSQQIEPSSDVAPPAAGTKRKRAKAPKQDGGVPDSAHAHTPTTGGSHVNQSLDLLHSGLVATSKKQRKLVDARTPAQASANGSASPAGDSIASAAASGLGHGGTPLGSDAQMLPSLDANSAHGGDFNTAAFETLSSHLGQGGPTSLSDHHHNEHNQALSSHHQQHLSQQHRQRVHQQPLVNGLSGRPPVHAADNMRGLQTPRHQSHQQQAQQHLGQSQTSHQTQQHHQQHVPGHTLSPTPPQNNAHTQMAASLSSGSLASQQLPRPSRTPQPFYAQNRSGSNNQFGQPLPQPQQHQQQHQQPPQQATQKSQFAQQYQAQGPYSQPQQQQAFVAQQRHPPQSMDSSPPGLLSQGSTHRSPQFGTSGVAALRAGPSTYGTSPSAASLSFGSPTYDQARRQNTAGSPSLGGAYGASGTGPPTLGHHGSPSFGTSRSQPSPGASQNPHVGSTAQSLQSFHGFDNPSFFDQIGLDAASGGGGLGLGGAAQYGLGGHVQRAPSGTAGFGSASSSVNPFDAAALGANGIRDRFYGVRR